MFQSSSKQQQMCSVSRFSGLGYRCAAMILLSTLAAHVDVAAINSLPMAKDVP